MIPVLLGFVLIVVMATAGALESMKVIQAQGGTVDVNAITALAQSHAKETAGYFRVILLLMFFCWLFAIIDAYRIGSKRVREGDNSG
jgi:hypothetical protein